MKIRYGFVSNSSSSSFCIHKQYMTEEQIEEFRKIIDLPSDGYYIGEVGKYFLGRVDQNNSNVFNFLEQFNEEDYAVD